MRASERSLVTKLKSGGEEGFREVYDYYSPRVTGFVLRLCGDRCEAEDIVQEVFVAAYTSRAQFQGRSTLLTWLLGIAARRWRDRRRKSDFHTIVLSDEHEDTLALEADAGTSVEKGVIQSLTLNDALEKLAPRFREAVLLVVSQGQTYKEAAEIMGEPVGTVKWRVSQATRRLAAILHSVEGEFDAM